jgi:hypothetical protein
MNLNGLAGYVDFISRVFLADLQCNCGNDGMLVNG